MNSNLKYEDFALLLALQTDPFMPMTELADRLNISRITAKKRIENLKERGIIRNPIAVYNPRNLGLKRVNICTSVASMHALKVLETACEEHPYTRYRVRIFGGGFGLFIQFDIPHDLTPLLKEFFDKLQTEQVIETYDIFDSTGLRADTFPDLSRFDPSLSSWDFSWKTWFNSLSQFSSEVPSLVESEADYSSFNPKNFKILRLLTSNASLRQVDIRKQLSLSRTEAYRQYNYVMNNYIDKIRLIYNREIFGLTETYIAFGHPVKLENAAQLYHAIKENPPPFRLSVDISKDDRIHLWANMSTAQASAFAFSVWEKLVNIQIYTLDTRSSETSFLYWFYPDNFDFDEMKWRTSRAYVVDDPLDRTYTKFRNS
ncbi:MAG: Lrp/AsnC family transcriptional regulator [Candidatus Hodarchaeota archaeon]